MTYSMTTFREPSKKVFKSAKFEVQADSKGNHYITRLSDGQTASFVGNVTGNQVFSDRGDITDTAIEFWAAHDIWFM